MTERPPTADHERQTTDESRLTARDEARAVIGRRRPAMMKLLLVIWLGVALRFHGLFANTFHADEALFAGWARLIAVWRDPLLLTQAVDKPPLPFYLQALFYPLFGPVEFAARLPSLVASILLIPLTAQLARRLTGDRTAAVLAAAVVAVAPLAVQFSATAFVDPLLTLWLTAALYAAAGRARPGPAAGGLLFGLALATKYQALLFAPLLVGLARMNGWRRGEWLRAAAGLVGMLIVLLLWQSARPTGLVALQWANVGGVRLARSWELWPRLAQMARLWQLALGGMLLAAGAAAVAGYGAARRDPRRMLPAEGMVFLFVAAYLALHWLWAVPVWDRYLLPVLPPAAVLVGRGVSLLLSAVGPGATRRWVVAGLALLAVLHIPTVVAARDGRYLIGGQPEADGGSAAVARLLEDAPYGTVLYDHWYSWQWRYHLFDSRVYVSWFPHVDALLADLAAFGAIGPGRYIVLPETNAARPVIRRLAEAGYRLERLPGPGEPARMALYRIMVEKLE